MSRFSWWSSWARKTRSSRRRARTARRGRRRSRRRRRGRRRRRSSRRRRAREVPDALARSHGRAPQEHHVHAFEHTLRDAHEVASGPFTRGCIGCIASRDGHRPEGVHLRQRRRGGLGGGQRRGVALVVRDARVREEVARVRVLGARAVVEQNDGPDAREHDVLARLRAQTGEAGDENVAWPSLRCASTPHTRSWRSYTARCSAVSSSPEAPAIARIPESPRGALCLPCARDLIATTIASGATKNTRCRFSRVFFFFVAVHHNRNRKPRTRRAVDATKARTYLYTRERNRAFLRCLLCLLSPRFSRGEPRDRREHARHARAREQPRRGDVRVHSASAGPSWPSTRSPPRRRDGERVLGRDDASDAA